MPIISRQMEIQEQLISTVEELKNHLEDLKNQINSYKTLYNKACTRHIESGYQKEWLLDKIVDKHENTYMRLDILKIIDRIVSEYRDFDGIFLDYEQMVDCVEGYMLRYAEQEHYEAAAVFKQWFDKFQSAILLEAYSS